MQGQPTPQQINAFARAAIKASAVPMFQQIFQQTFASAAGVPSVQPVVTVQPRQVGLIRGFWVKVQATITNNGVPANANLTDLGAANLLSQIQFIDLQNNTRIQTPGWHIAFLNAVKGRRPMGAAWVNGTGFQSGPSANANYPMGYGNNWTGQIQAPSQIANGGAAGTVVMWYYVPLSYSADDLRGAVYANVLNATMQLNLTFTPNAQLAVANGTDSTSAVLVGSAAGSMAACLMTSATITVYQDYLDQLPQGNGGVLLPILDLATIYEIKNTPFSAIVANTDFPIQYANYRDFLSTTLIYVNTAATGARTGGTDINFLALQSANFTNLWKKNTDIIGLQTRNHLQTDLPVGCYYFGSREKPISTVQYGNMQLILNAQTAGAGAYALVGWESFALVQTLSNAGSLAAS